MQEPDSNHCHCQYDFFQSLPALPLPFHFPRSHQRRRVVVLKIQKPASAPVEAFLRIRFLNPFLMGNYMQEAYYRLAAAWNYCYQSLPVVSAAVMERYAF